jgi:hypothetical protein
MSESLIAHMDGHACKRGARQLITQTLAYAGVVLFLEGSQDTGKQHFAGQLENVAEDNHE